LAILKKILLRDFVSGTAVASELSRPTGLSSLCYNAHCDNLMEVALFSIMSVCGWMGGWVGGWVGGCLFVTANTVETFDVSSWCKARMSLKMAAFFDALRHMDVMF